MRDGGVGRTTAAAATTAARNRRWGGKGRARQPQFDSPLHGGVERRHPVRAGFHF